MCELKNTAFPNYPVYEIFIRTWGIRALLIPRPIFLNQLFMFWLISSPLHSEESWLVFINPDVSYLFFHNSFLEI